MSWIQQLYETYDRCIGLSDITEGSVKLTPLYHVLQQAHIEITLDGSGEFRRASIVNKENTLIPATEKSATARTSAVVPHPLCDHVKYCAGDYLESGNDKNKYYEKYTEQLKAWSHSHPKVTAILKYVEKKTVLHDLIREKIMPVGSDGHILRKLEANQEKPSLFKQLTLDSKTKEYKPQNALIRWRVELTNDLSPEVWKDKKLQDAWLDYCSLGEASKMPGLCMVTGDSRVLAEKHPSKIRNAKDGAKLISNKKEADSNFIYLGRFTSVQEAAGVGIEVSQKAHKALQWLISRQGFQNGDQVIIAWAVSGKQIPSPLDNSYDLFGIEVDEEKPLPQYQGDAGQAFGRRLKKLISGYRAEIGGSKNIVVMGVDSATPGRLAITFYRELTGSELLARIQSWHENFAWHQHYSKEIRFVGAPSPKEIAETAYGRRLDDKLLKATIERLLPCIIDGLKIPRDLVESSVRRTCNRPALEHWEFEKNLGITCSLFKGYFTEGRNYQMALEQDRTTRDYLYGRLFAIAEHLENRALYLAGENRETSATRLMQRFADRPFSTWRTIELSLSPYKARLRASRPSFLNEMEKQFDEVMGAFQGQDFLDDRRLSGEFLLAYHCQRLALWSKREAETNGKHPDS